ncbi:hypothetical protein [Palleronia sp.]
MTFTFIKGAILAGALGAPRAHAAPEITQHLEAEPPAIVLTVPADGD